MRVAVWRPWQGVRAGLRLLWSGWSAGGVHLGWGGVVGWTGQRPDGGGGPRCCAQELEFIQEATRSMASPYCQHRKLDTCPP